ncbi:gliding motility lipoprotein GldD [Ascidiimonas aurantiaca]|uniref:gliding motility lipoprotein GldD n=1 Tax=Ascidiimonas aurantiaca TaxID=1685432 RepID=UPI0030ECE6BB
MKTFYTVLFILIFTLTGCEQPVPKPRAMLRLDYPEASYKPLENDCPFVFNKNVKAVLKASQACQLVLEYPAMKASIHLTYRKVANNLDSLLRDAQKLTYEHVIKADNISEQPFENAEARVYGMLYEIGGNAASQSQFYVTDNSTHFLTGALYFYAKPNYDSILPAAHYLKKDIRTIMETLKWETNMK